MRVCVCVLHRHHDNVVFLAFSLRAVRYSVTFIFASAIYTRFRYRFVQHENQYTRLIDGVTFNHMRTPPAHRYRNVCTHDRSAKEDKNEKEKKGKSERGSMRCTSC